MPGRWLVGGASVFAATTLLACGTSDNPPGPGAESHVSTAHGAAPDCGTAPASSGPLARLARLTVKAPATASSGRVVAVSATVTSNSSAARVITTPASSALLVVRGRRVVGRTVGGPAPNVPLRLTAGSARPAQVIPKSVRLAGCGPDAGTAALAPGNYALVAVLGYQLDSLNGAPAGGAVPPPPGGRSFALVSAPAPLTVS